MSSSLFGAQEQSPVQHIPIYTVKNNLFRQEIRRKHNSEKFRAVRLELMHSLKSLEFLENLKSQKDNFTAKKIKQLMVGLQMGLNNVDFYQKMRDMQLDHYLCDILTDRGLQLEEKTKIMHTLVQLTFFCSSSVQAVIQNHIIDYLMSVLKNFQMDDPLEESFTFYAGNIVLNSSAVFNSELNIFIMESDFMKIFQNLVEKSSRKQENLMYYRSDIRQLMLQIYRNLFNDPSCNLDFVAQVIFRLLNDHRNSDNQHTITQLLACISVSANIPNLWLFLQQQKYGFFGVIFGQLGDLALSLKTFLLNDKQVVKGIQKFIDFLNNLYNVEDKHNFVAIGAGSLVSSLQPQIIQTFIIELHRKDTGPSKKVLCKIYQMLSYTFQQISYKSIFPTKHSLSCFLQKLIQKNFITNPSYGKYTIRILWRILKDDKTVIDMMVDHGIYDAIRDLLDFQFMQQAKIEIIQLVECMIGLQQSIKPKQETNNKLVQAFLERGIIKDIDKLQDHELRQLYKRAESFMQWLSQLPSQISNSE